MGTGMKVFLIIVAVIFLIVGGFIGVAVYFGLKATETMEEAASFAAETDKEGCLTEVARRMADCEGVSCVTGGTMFGLMCLSSAEGDAEDICDNGTSTRDQAQQYCDAQQGNEGCPEMMRVVIDQYCRDPDAMPSL